MTTSDGRYAAAGLTGWLAEDAAVDGSGEPVGASDAEADAARADGEGGLPEATRDSDGEPVGEGDLAADIERSGGDPDQVR